MAVIAVIALDYAVAVTAEEIRHAKRMTPSLLEVHTRRMVRRFKDAQERAFWAEWERLEAEDRARHALALLRRLLVRAWLSRAEHEMQRGVGIGPATPGTGDGWGAVDYLAEALP